MDLNMGFVLLLTFLFGLIIGSFLNVCIYRIPRGESIVFPPSHCPSCQHQLQVNDLLPVISYIILRGKCRYCGEKIHFHYPLIELINGLGWVLVMFIYRGEIVGQSIAGIFLFSFSLVLALIDLRHFLIPNCLVISLLLAGIVYQIFWGELSLLQLFLGMVVGFVVPLVIALFSGGGMGGGDIKLCAAMGLWLGYPAIIYAMFIGALLGSIIGILLMVFKIKTRKDPIPFGPFLMLGLLAIFFFQKQIMFWYLSIVG